MAEKNSIHYAGFDKSKRLQRFIQFLLSNPGSTTLEIIRATHVCNPNTAKAECKKQDFQIECGRDEKGYFRYTVTFVPERFREMLGIPKRPEPMNAVQTPLF